MAQPTKAQAYQAAGISTLYMDEFEDYMSRLSAEAATEFWQRQAAAAEVSAAEKAEEVARLDRQRRKAERKTREKYPDGGEDYEKQMAKIAEIYNATLQEINDKYDPYSAFFG